MSKTILWWGRYNSGYSRNRIVQRNLAELGWECVDFRPPISPFGDVFAYFGKFPKLAAVWVPNFRQRDCYAAIRFANFRGLPLIFDPLISSYDKRVFEHQKYSEESIRAHLLKRWESGMFKSAALALADTDAHGRFFVDKLAADPLRVFSVPVGAEEELFFPQPFQEKSKEAIEVLFYGSFVPLQGADVIVKAAKLVPEVKWTLLGSGKLRPECEKLAAGCDNIFFEDRVAYESLAQRIGEADILLGVFGETPKARRVIPNKFYQSIACARPVITMDGLAYSDDAREAAGAGVAWVPPGDPAALAATVREWSARPDFLSARGRDARSLYETCYSEQKVKAALSRALKSIQLV